MSIPNENRTITTPTAAAIRSALRAWLSEELEPGTILVNELGLRRGAARADLAVVNGRLHGYEIKSDRDSLRRLPGQANSYGAVFELVTLVVGERHSEAAQVVPDWWGVLMVTGSEGGELTFNEVRPASMNPELDPRSLVELLWTSQALALLETRDAARGVRGKPRRVLWDRVCREFCLNEIAEAVRASLKARAESPTLA